MKQLQTDFSVDCNNLENGKFTLDLDVPDGSYLETMTVNGKKIFPDDKGFPVAGITLKIRPDTPPTLEIDYHIIAPGCKKS